MSQKAGPESGLECSICHGPIEEHPDEVKTIMGSPVCEGCYYEGLGAQVELHPIVSGRVGHGVSEP